MFRGNKKLGFAEIFPACFVGFLFILNLLPLLAPILAWLGEKNISGFIYWLYSFSCHQKSSRSFSVCDHQYGWCARCTFLWFSTFLSSLIVFYGPKSLRITGLKWQTAVVFIAPMALDGGIQLIASIFSVINGVEPFYESTNSIRAVTGTFFGIGLGLFLFPRLKEEIDANKQAQIINPN